MKFQILAATSLLFSVIYCQPANDANISQVLERFKGTWKEDPSKREGLKEFLDAAGIDDSVKKVALSAPWEGEKIIEGNGNELDISGKTGPNLPGVFDNSFKHHLVADNKTVAEVDLKVIKLKV